MIELPADTRAPARAREECHERTRQAVERDVARTACLLVSELVTNTVRHGDCQPDEILELRIERRADHLEVAVCQRAPIGHLRARKDQEVREGGWGLMLVDHLADEWGVAQDPHCVWFRLAA